MTLANVLLGNHRGPFEEIAALNPATQERRVSVERSNRRPISIYMEERPVLIKDWYCRCRAKSDGVTWIDCDLKDGTWDIELGAIYRIECVLDCGSFLAYTSEAWLKVTIVPPRVVKASRAETPSEPRPPVNSGGVCCGGVPPSF